MVGGGVAVCCRLAFSYIDNILDINIQKNFCI